MGTRYTVPEPPFSADLLAELHADNLPPDVADKLWPVVLRDPEAVRILDGRYGTYVTVGTTNASLPKGTAVESATMAEAQALLEARAGTAKPKGRRGAKTGGARKTGGRGRKTSPAAGA